MAQPQLLESRRSPRPFLAVRLLVVLAALPGLEAGWEEDWVTAQGGSNSFAVTSFSHPTVTLSWLETPSVSVNGFVVTVTSVSCGQSDSNTGGDNVCNFQTPTDASPAVLLSDGSTNLSYTVTPILGAQMFHLNVKAFRWDSGEGSTMSLSNKIERLNEQQARHSRRRRRPPASALRLPPHSLSARACPSPP